MILQMPVWSRGLQLTNKQLQHQWHNVRPIICDIVRVRITPVVAFHIPDPRGCLTSNILHCLFFRDNLILSLVEKPRITQNGNSCFVAESHSARSATNQSHYIGLYSLAIPVIKSWRRHWHWQGAIDANVAGIGACVVRSTLILLEIPISSLSTKLPPTGMAGEISFQSGNAIHGAMQRLRVVDARLQAR